MEQHRAVQNHKSRPSLGTLNLCARRKGQIGVWGYPQGVGWLCGWMVIQLHRVDTLCYVILPIQGIKKADAQASAFKLTFNIFARLCRLARPRRFSSTAVGKVNIIRSPYFSTG